jgi:hypothetical protein
MRRLILIVACLSLLTTIGLAQRTRPPAGAQESQPIPGVITAPGAQVITVPGDTAATPLATAAPCADAAHVRVALVIRAVANLRDRANVAGAVVGEVPKGGALVVEAEDGPGSPWYKVTDVLSGRQGWVHGNTIRIAYQK